jgi:hypothetical protein
MTSIGEGGSDCVGGGGGGGGRRCVRGTVRSVSDSSLLEDLSIVDILV